DERLLVTNQSPIAGNPDSWAVFDVFAGEKGLPLYRPLLAKSRLRIKVSRRRVPAGTPTTVRVRATRLLAAAKKPVAGVSLRLGASRARTGRSGRARLRVSLRQGRHRLRASKRGFSRAHVVIQAR